jgi:hypothetical protein
MWSRADVISLFSINVVSFSRNLVLSGPSFSINVVWKRAMLSVRDHLFSQFPTFIYEYDFGDSWAHEVVVEKTLPADPKKKYAVCLDGKNACPPEDCGGIWGYYDLLKAVKNPKHKEHQETLDRLGV